MPATAPTEAPIVHVVDDDEMLRRSIVFLLDSVGWEARAYESAEAFLAQWTPGRAGCLVLDIRMPTISGLELQRMLAQRGESLPIIFITGHGDVPLAVQAMKSGACDFLEKPFRDQALLEAVTHAVRCSQQAQAAGRRRQTALEALQALSPREREVARLLARGLPNKRVARELDISEKTVHVHRQHIMDKASVRSAAELARLMLEADPEALDGQAKLG